METNEITGEIVSAAIKVHTVLGPGLLESVYKACLHHELVKRGLQVIREHPVPVQYDGVQFEMGFRMDLFVEDRVIVEVKAARENPVHEAQLLSHMRLTRTRIGLLLNFHVASMKDGIKRMIN
jgi:GxxExxY protein